MTRTGFRSSHERGGWYEPILTIANDGYTLVIWIAESEQTDPDLLALCRLYAGRLGEEDRGASQ